MARIAPFGRGAAVAFVALALLACGRGEPRSPSPPSSDTVEPFVPSVGGLQARRTEMPDVVADLLGAERDAGILTVSVRFRNTGTDTVDFAIPTEGGTYPAVRLQAAGRLWPIARERDGDPTAPRSFVGTLKPGQSMLWRVRFEAPPRDVTSFDLAMPRLRQPFEDVPISDPTFESRPEEMEAVEPAEER